MAPLIRRDLSGEKPQMYEGPLRPLVQKLLRNGKSLFAIVTLLTVLLIALLADVIAPYHYNEQNLGRRLQPPSSRHLFGTDALGRDVFSRVLYGARMTLFLGVTITFFTSLIGITLGLISGYAGGIIDLVVRKVMDVLWAFPIIVLALGLAALLGPSTENLILVLSVLLWIPFARVVRAKVLVIKELPFVKYARAIGMNPVRLIFRHIFPNVLSDIIVLFVLTIPDAMMSSAALSFLGLGVQPPTPEWGAIISDGRPYLFTAPWISAFPGLFLLLVALSFNLLGDVLTDILNPRVGR